MVCRKTIDKKTIATAAQRNKIFVKVAPEVRSFIAQAAQASGRSCVATLEAMIDVLIPALSRVVELAEAHLQAGGSQEDAELLVRTFLRGDAFILLDTSAEPQTSSP